MHHVINAFESSGFLLKDVLIWKKDSAHYKAQRLSIIFERRGLMDAVVDWDGWRVGNLAPAYEPISWFIKPYKIGTTIADNVLANGVGAINGAECKKLHPNCTNILEFGFEDNEKRVHEAQKPLKLIEFLIKLTTKDGQIILDPFMGSGTTALAAKRLKRQFIGFELIPQFYAASLQRLSECQFQ